MKMNLLNVKAALFPFQVLTPFLVPVLLEAIQDQNPKILVSFYTFCLDFMRYIIYRVSFLERNLNFLDYFLVTSFVQ